MLCCQLRYPVFFTWQKSQRLWLRYQITRLSRRVWTSVTEWPLVCSDLIPDKGRNIPRPAANTVNLLSSRLRLTITWPWPTTSDHNPWRLPPAQRRISSLRTLPHHQTWLLSSHYSSFVLAYFGFEPRPWGRLPAWRTSCFFSICVKCYDVTF